MKRISIILFILITLSTTLAQAYDTDDDNPFTSRRRAPEPYWSQPDPRDSDEARRERREERFRQEREQDGRSQQQRDRDFYQDRFRK